MTGGIIWGYGQAVLEESPMDPALGRFLSKNLAGVVVPVHADIPPKWNGIPMIGLIGFVIATVMGFWLLVSILRHGKM